MTNRYSLVVYVLIFLAGALAATFAVDIVDDAHAQSSNGATHDRFNLVDRLGKNRGSIGLSGGNQEYTYMYLSDSSGRPRVRFTVYPDRRAPTMEFLDVNGKAVATAAAPSAPNLGDVGQRATGQYRDSAAGDEAADQVITLARPANPGGDARKWLDAHNAALLGIVRSRYSANDVTRFASAERSKCNGNIYCIMAFRQQAIVLIVGV
jgi:hypothetical protein